MIKSYKEEDFYQFSCKIADKFFQYMLNDSYIKSGDVVVSKDSYIRRERHYGEFTRNFYIVNVDEEQICAEFKEGVLKVTMPKEKIENSKKIEIK